MNNLTIANFQKDHLYNFKMLQDKLQLFPYEYGSIMHYAKYAYAILWFIVIFKTVFCSQLIVTFEKKDKNKHF